MPLLADTMRNLCSFLTIVALILLGLYLGQNILVPMTLAVLLSFILAPIAGRMTAAGLPHALAVVVSIAMAAGVVGIAIYAFSSEILALAQNLENYKLNLMDKVRAVTRSWGETTSLQRAAEAVAQLQRDIMHEIGETPEPSGAALSAHVPGGSLSAVGNFVAAIGAPVGKALLTILLAFFLLLQYTDLRDRVIRVVGTNNMSSATAAINEAAARLSTLFLAQAAINAAFGIFIGLSLWLIGVPNAGLWGISAAVLRFVPFIGSFIAAVPPLLLAAGVEPGWGMFFTALTLFLIGEPLMGHIIEPLVLGKRAGLSPFAVVVALSVWTLLWGPIGLILAVPVTLALVVLGRYVPGAAFLSVILGDDEPLTAEQRFYNRLLSNDASSAITEIEDATLATSMARVVDDIVLPALRLASADHNIDRLDTRHLAEMRDTMELVGAAFDDGAGLKSVSSPTPHATSVIVVPARGAIDQMAAKFIATLLNGSAGYLARSTDTTGLTALAAAKAALDADDHNPAVVIATTGGSNSAQLRLIVNRAATIFPQNAIYVVGTSGEYSQLNASNNERSPFLGSTSTFEQLQVRLLAHHCDATRAAARHATQARR